MEITGSVSRVTRTLGDGADSAIQLLRGGELAATPTHAKYQEAVLRGGVYFLSGSALAPTAYVGAAGGTPLLALHNPANSGKNLVLLAMSVANRVAASAAGTVSFGVWGGPSVIPTGTQTTPTNMMSLAATGAAAKGFANAALTGSTALNLLMSPTTYYWATAAGAIFGQMYTHFEGLIIIAPGNQVAMGATSALTSATWDVSLIWDEIPAI